MKKHDMENPWISIKKYEELKKLKLTGPGPVKVGPVKVSNSTCPPDNDSILIPSLCVR